jgi:hypothetical protein
VTGALIATLIALLTGLCSAVTPASSIADPRSSRFSSMSHEGATPGVLPDSAARSVGPRRAAIRRVFPSHTLAAVLVERERTLRATIGSALAIVAVRQRAPVASIRRAPRAPPSSL